MLENPGFLDGTHFSVFRVSDEIERIKIYLDFTNFAVDLKREGLVVTQCGRGGEFPLPHFEDQPIRISRLDQMIADAQNSLCMVKCRG